MATKFRAFTVLAAFVGCLFLGTMGYYLIEGWSFLDSLYMTVITITTVGFHEENPLSPEGKIFTIFLIFGGFGISVYTFSNITQLVLSGDFVNWLRRYTMKAKIEILKNHYILCGWGRMGKVVARHLEVKGIPFVVIESSEDKASKITDMVYPVIVGSSGDETVLRQAGVMDAQCLISVVSTDAENAFTVMTARRLNKDLHIVSRCFIPTSAEKIKLAGANQVISPYELSGHRITQAALHPTMVEFVEFIEDVDEAAIEMADLEIEPNSKIAGLKLSDEIFGQLGVMVVGIKKEKGEFAFHPRGDTVVNAKDHLVVVGPREKVGRVADFCEG